MIPEIEPTASIYFDNDHVFLSLIERDSKGLSLAYVNSTTRPVDFFQMGEPAFDEMVAELQETLAEIAFAATRVTVALAMENLEFRHLPAPENLATNEMQRLLEFELAQMYPGQDLKQFSTDVFPLRARLDKSSHALAVITDRQVRARLDTILEVLGAPVTSVLPAQVAAQNAVLYNYPERTDHSIMLVGIQGKYADVSIMQGTTIAYQNVLSIPPGTNLGEMCNNELETALSNYVPFVDSILMFGYGLHNSALSEVRSHVEIPVERCNAFRMFTTTLGSRERDYCARTAHIFPPCVGAALPLIQPTITL